MTEPNVHEERARARKAFRLSRVLVRAMEDHPEFTIEDVEDATPETRLAAARVAGVREPSDRTWAVMCDLLREQRGSVSS